MPIPSDYAEGRLFLYTYKHKGAFHIRVANSFHTQDKAILRASQRRAYSRAESDALGLDETFLRDYYGASKWYFSARMGMNQNRPLPTDALSDFPPEWRADIERGNAYRYAECKKMRHRAWSDLALLRKRARAALGV